MWCADARRRTHRPFRIEPEVGQRSENSIKSPNKQAWDVFHEDVARSHFANHSEHFPPEPAAFAFKPLSLACDRHVLAREPTADDIGSSSPSGAVEGSDVVMDREWFENTVVLSFLEHATAIGVDLDSTNAAVS
jgi:hypothetical protein